MKIHTFIRDTKLMEQNEREAIRKRKKLIKQRSLADSSKTEKVQKGKTTQKKKKKKEAV